MTPADTGKAYDRITHLWESEKFNRNNGIAPHERALAFVKNTGRALDAGCGCTGRFIDLLMAQGFEPEGVDISGKMIRLARQRHPQLSFYQEDICQWPLPHSYDFITAWDIIWHVPLAQQRPLLDKLAAALNPGGVLIFSFGGMAEAGEHIDDYMGPEVYYASLGINGLLQWMLDTEVICRHLEYDQYPELHTYLIVQKPDQADI